MSIIDVFEHLKRTKLISIIRGNYTVDDINTIAETLIHESVLTLEITLNSSSALSLIESLRKHFGNAMVIGAGTVRTAAQVQQAADAGAQFIVSPNYDPLSVALSQKLNLLHLPGVATPTEAQAAFVAGCKVVKLFPADLLGGPAYLKAIRAPLDDIDFMASGGITAENAAAYLQSGAMALGIGGWLISATNWNLNEIKLRAKMLQSACS